MSTTASAKIAILDAGSQYAKVIDRRVRELCVHSEILPMDTPVATLNEFSGVIISGGPQSVYGAEAPKYCPELFSGCTKPILGICYGMQLMNYALGGVVAGGGVREDGQFEIRISSDVSRECPLFSGLGTSTTVLLTHGDSVRELAPDFEVTAVSAEGLVAAIAHKHKPIFGVQFHPEVDLTVDGTAMLRNFVCGVVGAAADFTPASRKDTAIAHIRARVGSDQTVLVLVSGGVDSTVCAALLAEALGPARVLGLHVDSGFMRKDESAQVMRALEALGVELMVANAAETFAQATTTVDGRATVPLCDAVAPEEKRKIIGDTFMRVTDATLAARGLDPAKVILAQGTLRPDLIESASSLATKGGAAAVIKTHHNDTALVRQLRALGRIVEPLADYHKDEVRALGIALGLAPALVWRQPFPGPGLAIRVLCAREPYCPPNKEHMEARLEEIMADAPGLSAVVLPSQTVGVQGDGRTYAALVGLFSDAASASEIDWTTALSLARKIPTRVHGVNRVVFVFGPRVSSRDYVPSITPTVLSADVLDQLREADAAVNEVLWERELVRKLSQVPVILFPVNFGLAGARSVCIRTFITNDFMTGVPAVPGSSMLPFDALDEMVTRICARTPGVARVCFDLTAKPPGTTEWE